MNNCIVIGGGDMNCRVGDVTQVLPSNCKYRKNPDSVTNSHGRSLRKICSAYGAFILNNLDINDLSMDGKFTFYRGKGKSQSDLCLTNKTGLKLGGIFRIISQL